MLEDYELDAAGKVRRFTEGLFRSVLAGPGQSLCDAFDKLEHASQVQIMSRHTKRGLLGGRIALHSHEGHGYWDLTRVRNDIFVVVANFTYNNTRMEFVPGDGLVQFNFKLCGDMTLAVNARSEEHTSELQSHLNIVCRLLLEKKNTSQSVMYHRT